MSLRPVRARKPKHRRVGYANLHWSTESSVEQPGKFGLRTKLFALGVLIILFVFAIGRYETLIPSVFGDYNTTYSHTRTPIFQDTEFNGIAGFSSANQVTCTGVSTCSLIPKVPHHGVILVSVVLISVTGWSSTTISDSNLNTYTISTGCLAFCTVGHTTSSSGSVTVTVGCTPGGCTFTGKFSVTVYGGVASFGNTATNAVSLPSTPWSDSLSITTSSTNSIVWESGGILSNPSASTCPTITASSSQSLITELTCQSSGAARSLGKTFDKTFAAIGVQTVTLGGIIGTPSTSNLLHKGIELIISSVDASPVTNPDVKWNYNTTCVDLLGPGQANAVFDYSLGNNIGVATVLDSFHPTVDDFSRLIPPTMNTGVGESFQITGNSWQIGSTQFLMNQTSSAWSGSITSQIYAITGTAGVNGKPTDGPLATSQGVTSSSLTTGAPTAVTFTFSNTRIFNPGSYFVTLNASAISSSLSAFPRAWSKNNGFVYSGGRNDAFFPNATEGWKLGGDDLWYTVTGLNSNPGINCNSADIMITKRASNFQVVSARMLEAVMAWQPGTSTPLLNVTLVLRTNGTLPSFREKYNPFNDAQARLIWTACPTFTCIRVLGTNNGTQSLYILHDRAKTVNQEGLANDLILNQTAPNFKISTQDVFQTVLNFTGPTNFMQEQTVTTAQNSASAFQMGEDYYVLVMVSFDTTNNPGAFSVSMLGNQLPANGSGDYSLGFWSVPASCADPVNKTACSTPTAQPVFDFNPLDPSSWANSIIKGLTWVFVSAIPQFVTFIIQGTLLSMQVILNVVGNFFGWGNVGDTLISWINQLVTFFSTSMAQLVAQLASLFSPVLSITTILLTFFASGPISGFITAALSTGIATVSLVVSIVLRVVLFLALAYGLMEILLWFVYCADFGLAGYQAWIETSKWLLFGTGIKVLIHFFNFGLDIITALIGLIPKPFIQMIAHRFPRIPIVDISGYPTWPRFDAQALCDLDLFALFGIGLGAIFLIQYETTNLPGTIGSVSNIQMNYSGFINLFLVFASVGGVILLVGMPTKIVMAFARCIELIGGRVAVGGVSPATRAGLAEIGERAREKVLPGKAGKVRVSSRTGGKRFQGRLQRKLGETRKEKEFTEEVQRSREQELKRLAREEVEEQRREQEQQRREQQRRVEVNLREDIARQLERNE